jgi:hypothetical protein
MENANAYMRLQQIRPLSPHSEANLPPSRQMSMTEVITPESPSAYRAARNAADGSPLDATSLRAHGMQSGYMFPGWVGYSTAMVIPGSTGTVR